MITIKTLMSDDKIMRRHVLFLMFNHNIFNKKCIVIFGMIL